ncbi:MAG: M24 family metallopeptidase [Planctomycetota bacterium]
MTHRIVDSATRRAFLATCGLTAASCAAGRNDSDARESKSAARDTADDDALAALSDQRHTGEPIQPTERAQRRKRAGTILAQQSLDAVLMEGGATMSYLSGVGWGHSERMFGLVQLADGSHFWICPRFEESKACLRIDADGGPGGEIVAWDEHEYAYRPLAAALRARGVERLGIEPGLRYGFADRTAEAFGREHIASGQAFVIALRSRKDAHELALLRRANELTQLAIRTVADRLEPGMRGSEIAGWMDRAHKKLGMSSPWCLALIGPAAALPHGDPSRDVLARGDVVLIDTGASFHGYQSDNTRTWVFGAAPSAEVERVWHCVRDAQRRAFEATRPGVRCGDIDLVARAHIEASGFGPGYRTFTHRLGHGIGMEGHEDPYFDSGSDVVLASGMTLSSEPGIYLPERFGVRIEDIVAVTETGADHFGTWQLGPRSPA